MCRTGGRQADNIFSCLYYFLSCLLFITVSSVFTYVRACVTDAHGAIVKYGMNCVPYIQYGTGRLISNYVMIPDFKERVASIVRG